MRRKTILIIIFAINVVFSFSECSSQNTTMNTTIINEFDLNRYLGTWYEIARFDHRFERGLQGVTATYSLRDDGKIKVVNQGHKNTPDGKLSRAVGKAKTTNDPGKLKVSFFWIFYADYFILELDKNYQWALIGSSSPKYLWILSRTPQIETPVKDYILNKAKQRGYDVSKLIWVEQNAVGKMN